MHLLYIDESNLQTTKNADFFICGGAVIPLATMADLGLAVDAIRKEAGFAASDRFKFDTNSRPAWVDESAFAAAKDKVLVLANRLEIRFIAYAAPHRLAQQQGQYRTYYYGLHTVVSHFQLFLQSRQPPAHGIVVADRMPIKEGFKLLGHLHQMGGDPSMSPRGRFPNIDLFGMSIIEASHVASVADILIGAFRYCVNEPHDRPACFKLLPLVLDRIWGTKTDEGYRVLDAGLIIRPQRSKSESIKALTCDLLNTLERFAGGIPILNGSKSAP